MDWARLAKMHLAVDHAGQHVQTGAIDPLAGRSCAQIADRSDAAFADADVTLGDSILIDDRAPRKNEIECLRHWPHPCVASLARRLTPPN